MTTLIAIISTGKGTWSEVSRLMDQAEWDHIVLVTYPYGKEHFSHPKNFSMVVTDFSTPMALLCGELTGQIGKLVPGGLATEVALNLSSGSGKEHMALIGAVLKNGLALRLVVPGEKDIQEV
ncbi:MAG: hypothetical protein GXP63_06390 [DPANN group archaeon]|nr:hypothetical protein [DPANN group archaeon]